MDFIIDNFDKLFDSEENFKKLEEIILDLAVKGKLVPQNPEDEPASVLLEKIQKENTKNYKPVGNNEESFGIPDSWEWVRLGDVLSYKQGFQIGTEEQISEEREGYSRYLRIIDFRSDDDLKYIKSPNTDVFCKRDDLLMIRYGGTK